MVDRYVTFRSQFECTKKPSYRYRCEENYCKGFRKTMFLDRSICCQCRQAEVDGYTSERQNSARTPPTNIVLPNRRGCAVELP